MSSWASGGAPSSLRGTIPRTADGLGFGVSGHGMAPYTRVECRQPSGKDMHGP